MKKIALATAVLAAALLIAVAVGLLSGPSALADQHAKTTTFDFKDPKGVNAVGFVLDSKLEPIFGMARGIHGTVRYDPADPGSLTGAIALPTSGVTTSNDRMTDVLHGAQWLNAAENSEVRFDLGKVTAVEPAGENKAKLTVRGKLTIAGVSLDKEVEVEATFVPDGAKARGGAKSGDLLVLRSYFKVNRHDFGIKKDMGPDKVDTAIQLYVAIAGYSK